jgi:hypothetical protein
MVRKPPFAGQVVPDAAVNDLPHVLHAEVSLTPGLVKKHHVILVNWVVLVDGDRHQIELIQAEAARRKAAVRLVIDLVHVLEYLWAVAWCFHARDDPAAEDWVAVQALAVLAGRVRQVTESLTAQAGQRGLAESQRTGVETCVRYLTNNEEYLRYDEALTAGWPIATGVIETTLTYCEWKQHRF